MLSNVYLKKNKHKKQEGDSERGATLLWRLRIRPWCRSVGLFLREQVSKS